MLGLTRRYALPRPTPWASSNSLTALEDVSLALLPGKNLGVVGESGSGKSTLGRLLMALERPDAGSVRLQGQDLHALSGSALRTARRDLQMVFQDPYGSLDPRQTVASTVTEPLTRRDAPGRSERRERAREALAEVGLRSADLDRYPHEFSGGQRQRIAIARALITRPKLIVADEPVSALDVSVQAQVVNLLLDLQQRHGMSYVLISHDLAVVGHLCEEVCVLQAGRIVERGVPAELRRHAAHAATRALFEAAR